MVGQRFGSRVGSIRPFSGESTIVISQNRIYQLANGNSYSYDHYNQCTLDTTHVISYPSYPDYQWYNVSQSLSQLTLLRIHSCGTFIELDHQYVWDK